MVCHPVKSSKCFSRACYRKMNSVTNSFHLVLSIRMKYSQIYLLRTSQVALLKVDGLEFKKSYSM